MRVVITSDAESDLDEIFEYIATDRPRAALKTVQRLRDRALRIGLNPRSHPAKPQYAPGLRVAVLGSYVIGYRIVADQVEVLHIVHGARDLKTLFEP